MKISRKTMIRFLATLAILAATGAAAASTGSRCLRSRKATTRSP